MSRGVVNVGGWRLPLRLARRETRRRPGRTILVALLVALPVMAMTLGSIVARTNDTDVAWEFEEEYGPVDVAVISLYEKRAWRESVREILPRGTVVTDLTTARNVPVLKADDERLFSAPLLGLGGASNVRLPSQGMDAADAPAADEVWVSEHVLERFQLAVGDTVELQYPSGTWTISGTGEPPAEHDRDVLVFGRLPVEKFQPQALVSEALIELPSDDVSTREDVIERVKSATGRRVSVDSVPQRETDAAAHESAPALAWGWVAGALALAALGIIIAAAFATSARRQLVTVGQLSANGASRRVVGRSLALQGFWTGVDGAVIGVAGGLVLVFAGRSTAERLASSDIPPTVVSAPDLVVIALTGIAAASIAAYLPARSAAKVPTLTALGGRRPAATVPARLVPIGLGLFAIGVIMLALAASSVGGNGPAAAAVLGGVLVMVAACCCSPLAIDMMSRLASRLGGSWRFAGRSLGRTRARSAAIATAICVAAAAALAGSVWVLLGIESANEEERTYPDDVVVFERWDAAVVVDGNVSGSAAAVPAKLREDVTEIVPESQWHDRRVATFTGPRRPQARLNSDRVRLTPAYSIVVADDAMLDLYELPEADRRALADTGALVLNDWIRSFRGLDSVRREPTLEVRLRTAEGDIRFRAAWREYLLTPELDDQGFVQYETTAVRGGDMLMVTEELAEREGLDVIVRGGFLRTPEAITRDQQERLDLVRESQFSFEGGLSKVYLDAPRDGDALWNVNWERVQWDPSGFRSQALIAVAATLLVLIVVAIGLSLAATESRDERDVLVAVGAKPSTMRRMAGVKAIVLTLTGAILAVPTGLIPAWAVMRATDQTFLMPWMQIALLLVAVPLFVGAAAWASSSVAQRARPVQMSNLALD